MLSNEIKIFGINISIPNNTKVAAVSAAINHSSAQVTLRNITDKTVNVTVKNYYSGEVAAVVSLLVFYINR